MYDQIEAAVLLNKLKKRLAGMMSIDKGLDLGGGLSVAAATQVSTEFSNDIDQLHKLEADVEKMRVKIDTMSALVRDLNKRVLSGVGARFGFDSDAYQQVGGKRQSQHKKPARGKQGAAKASAAPSPKLAEVSTTTAAQSATLTAPGVSASIVISPTVTAASAGRDATDGAGAGGGQGGGQDVANDATGGAKAA